MNEDTIYVCKIKTKNIMLSIIVVLNFNNIVFLIK